MDNNPKRKLSAIVFTDIVGFTELSAKNEPAALDLLIKQRETLKPIVEEYNGDWLKEIGDGLLLTFNTSIEAVDCCIAIQKKAEETSGLILRIAIHQGEVVLQGEDVVGDDVNIASRIEKYASPGGISISGRVNASLERNPDFSTNFLGSPNLKGVSQEVKIYAITSHGLPDAEPILMDPIPKQRKMNWNVYSITGAVLGLVGILFWINISMMSTGIASDNEIPSVVILPFENRGDSKEDYYAYGISSDIISDITSIGQLRVSSLSSVEELQKEGLKNNEIAEKLSSRYVVSGSLWKIDSIFQLSIELFDTDEEMLLTSQRWEMKWSDLSLVKDDLSKKIIEGLNIKIINELDNEYDIDPVAYELYLKAKHTFKDRSTVQDNKIADDLIEKALSIDQNFVDAKLYQAYMTTFNDSDKALELYEEADALALKMKDKKALLNAKRSMGRIYSERMETEKSLDLYKNAYRIAKEIGNENSIAKAMGGLGSYFWQIRDGDSARFYWEMTLELYKKLEDKEQIGSMMNNVAIIYWIFDNELDKAIEMFEESYNLTGWIGSLSNIGEIYNQKGEYEKSLKYYERSLNYRVSVNDKGGIAHMHRLYGQYYDKIHDYENAIKSWKISFDLHSELKYERWKAVSLGGLLGGYHALNQKENFEKYYSRIPEINTNIASQFYIRLGFDLMRKGEQNFARDCFFKQLELERANRNRDGIINTLTNIGLSYYYDGQFEKALNYFEQSIEEDGIENLWHTVETLIFKHLCQKELDIPFDDDFLKQYINKKIDINNTWFKNEPEYINWALYQHFGDSKYIMEAKRQFDLVLDRIKPDKVEKVSSYSMFQKILESYNKMENS